MAVAIFTLHVTGTKGEGLFFPLQEKWTTTLESPPSYPAAFDEMQAYVARHDNQLMALSLQTGKPVWSVECPMTTAPVAGDALLFSGRDGSIEARTQLDGKRRWQTPVEGRIDSLYWDTGWLIATTDKGAVLAIRAADGELLWHRDLGAGLQAAPAPAADRLYLPMKSGALIALDLNSGEPLWTVQLDQPVTGILALADRLYLGSLNKKFYCLSAKEGRVEWSWPTGAAVIGVPAIDTRRVYFVSLDNALRALDRNNGSMQWVKSMPTRPSAGPLLKGWTLVVPGITAELHAFSAVTGTPVGDRVLLSPQSQETQFLGSPHLTSEDFFITMTRGGVIQAFASSPSPYGP